MILLSTINPLMYERGFDSTFLVVTIKTGFKMKWQAKTGSLYSTHGDRAGRVRTFRQILFSDFGDNISDIVALRNLDRNAPDYEAEKRAIKNKLQCFALNELMNRKDVVKYSGLMQIDFDSKDCEGYDIEELKQAVFSLPFIAFVSLSCSGDGFYAIAAIAEPEKQKEYALHIFDVLEQYGLSCDKSKGRNYNDLRYVSYDANWLERDEVEPLRITQFKPVSAPEKPSATTTRRTNLNGNHGALIYSQAQKILSAQVGQRWHTVQQAAYTLGGRVWAGLNEMDGLQSLVQAIENNPAFAGVENKYIKCARDCYQAGQLKPLSA